MNPLAQFGMLGPKEVLLACSNQDDHTIQQKLNALNLMIAKLLVRYNLSDKLQQDLLRLGEHYLIVSPEILSVLDNNTSNVLLSLGLVVRPSVFFTGFEYPDYLEIVPTEKKPGYDERELENALVGNITRFLLELGKGFAFMGRQMELRMPDGKSYFPDLVFYHARLKSYVVVELKVVDFMPEFVGKLNFYVSAADELLKQPDDNQSIGLLICKSHDKTTVEWSFRGLDRPVGVASYQLQEVVDRTIAEMELDESQHRDMSQHF